MLSHLDFDHAGGLDDFPWAKVHLLADAVSSATAQRTALDRMRYRPQQWSTRSQWREYDGFAGERWFGFDCIRELDDIGPDVLLVPLGQTLGHAGVAVRVHGGWLLYAGDAYFSHAEMDPKRPRCTAGTRFYQTMMDNDRRAEGSHVTIFCAHDVREFARSSGHVPSVAAASRETPGMREPRRPVNVMG